MLPSDFVAKSVLTPDASRRSILKGFGACVLAAAGGPAPVSAAAPSSNGRLDYNDPKDNLYAFAKIWSSFEKPIIGGFHGLMYMRSGANRASFKP